MSSGSAILEILSVRLIPPLLRVASLVPMAKSRLRSSKVSILILRTLSAVCASTIELSVSTDVRDESSNSADEKTCTATTSTQTCNIEATGNIRYLASGWIWFDYSSKVQGHYDWAVSIEAILTNQDDRSSFAEFKGSMVANIRTSYAGSCV
ncbi:hypothetical protein EDD85DRAFT_1008418 [Armillaria nabsnona]|nr:hypothetical protein EDD85DRAFT_1008418 [Armillaria nabsnona]